MLRRSFLAAEIKLVEGGGEDRLHLGSKEGVSTTNPTFGRNQGREPATMPIVM
jgi:hypothetical protein